MSGISSHSRVVLSVTFLLASFAAGAASLPVQRGAAETAQASASSKGDHSWLLQPKTFSRLSAGGRNQARYLNGLPPLPAARAPRAPAAVTPGPLAAPAALQNIRVNDPSMDEAGHTNSESWLAVKGSRIIVGFNDASVNVSAYGLSTDGGGSFVHRRLPPPSGGQTFGDPVVAFGPNGEVYYSTLMVDSLSESTIGLAKSTDGGVTFGEPVDVAYPITNSVDTQDKDWLAVDAGATSPQKGNVYVSWTYFASTGEIFILFSRSTDGGQTFSFPGLLSPVDTAGVQFSSIAVAPNGDVYVAFADGHISPDGLTILKSTDGGVNFTAAPLVSYNSLQILTGGGGARASSYPVVAVDGKGVVHMTWAATATGATFDRSDVFYTRSTDAGKTFSAARKLNDDGTNTTQAFPALAAADDGSVAVKWFDRRNDPVNDGLNDVYMAISRDGGATFGKNFRVTDHNWVFGPIEAAIGGQYHGDYDGLAADGGNFYLSWSDERGSDPDVYFAFVPEGYDGGAPDFGVASQLVQGTVTAGQSSAFTIATSATNGFSGSLALSAGPSVPGLTFSFANAAVSAGQPAGLTISASSQAAAGNYLIAVTAMAGGVSRATNIWLTVYAAGRPAAPPVNVTATPGFTAGAGVKADASGTLHLLYEDDTAAVLGEDVFYRRSTDGGLTFSSPLKLNAAGSFGIETALAVGTSGRIVAAWTGTQTGDTNLRIYAARSTDGGLSFSAPVAVSPNSEYALYPVAAIDPSGKVLVAYYDISQATSYVLTSRSTNGGATFDTPVGISETTPGAKTRPGLAFDSKGGAYLTYDHLLTTGTLSSTVRLVIARDGRTFASPVDLTSTVDAIGPDVAVGPDDSVSIAFYNRTANATDFNRQIALVRSTDAGSTFSSQALVSGNTESYYPSLSVEPGGAIDVVWEDSTDTNQTDVFFSRSSDGGRTFSPPLDVSANLGLSGSLANPLEAGTSGTPGGSGRVAVSAGAAGSVFVSWTDDSPSNPDIFLARVDLAALTNRPPTAGITSPATGFSAEVGVPISFLGVGTDPEGGAVTFAWSFGDGTTGSGASPDLHPYAAAATYTVTLTVTDALGATATSSITVKITAPAVSGPSLLIPVVLESPGVGNSHYSTEVTLASREASAVEVLLSYTASQGAGSGYARLTLTAGELRILPAILGYLRARNLAIPADGSQQVGTLLVTFGGASSPATVFAGARTFTPDPAGGAGTFGLFYPAAATTMGSVTLFGLQQSSTQRSNVAVVNAGSDPITVRVALQGPNGEDLGTLQDQPLGPYGWTQINHPLLGLAASGRAIVTRVSGSSPLTAYAVLNDASTSDGSFLPPVLEGDTSGADRLVPVVLDVAGVGARFKTELTLTNFTSAPLSLTLVYQAADGFGSGSGSVPLTLAAGEQRIVPDAIAFLRGSLPIEADGTDVGGSLLVQAPAGTATGSLAVGARTYAPASPSGTFGLFFTGLTLGESATAAATIYGLQQNASQRSNLAIVNRGDAGDTITLRVTYFDGTGAALGPPVDQSLAPGKWHQFGHPLLGLGATSGYARVERIAGASRFVAYGVLNDNVTADGSYIPMSQ
jgi:PKD domain/BNR repeat-like domain